MLLLTEQVSQIGGRRLAEILFKLGEGSFPSKQILYLLPTSIVKSTRTSLKMSLNSRQMRFAPWQVNDSFKN